MAIGKVRHQVRASVVQLSNEIEEGKSIASMYKPVIEITANLAHLLVLLMEVQCVCVCVCVCACACACACVRVCVTLSSIVSGVTVFVCGGCV